MSEKPYWQQLRDLKLKGASKLGAPKNSDNSGNSDAHHRRKNAQDEEPTMKKIEKKPKASPALKKPKIKNASKKRAKENRQYAKIRPKFLQEHATCELGLEGCTGASSEIHHAGGRENKRLVKIEDFKAACHNCHAIATEKSREAIAAGNSKTRLGKPNKR